MTAPPPPHPDAPPPAVDGTASLLIMMARLEGKVDVALAQHGARAEEHARRIDDIEADHATTDARHRAALDALDARLRAVELRPVVSPRAMWAGVGIVAAVVGALSPLLDRLYS